MNKDYEEQESTEALTEEIIKNDEILMNYLKQDCILADDIINFKKYSIVDNDRPKLCADRLDGIILTSLYWTKTFNILDVKTILNDIIVEKNELGEDEITFRTIEVAKLVYEANKIINDFCHTNEDNYMMELLAKITKLAIKKDIIKYDNLYYLTESEVFEKLNNSNDLEIFNLIEIFQTISKKDIPKTELPQVKQRTLNPMVNKRRLK